MRWFLLSATLVAAQDSLLPHGVKHPSPGQTGHPPPAKIGQTVRTRSGLVSGQASDWQPTVSEYLGVPYAKPPVGDLRFLPPQKLEASNKWINATKFGLGCPENIGGPSSTMIGKGEDCLTLNVWTKPGPGHKKKAVMVWIYGGGFGSGASSTPVYNGARLAAEHDVVMVSVNYRVNVYGFPKAPWLAPHLNPGLLDQRAGIEWVRDNIEAFGGDPKRIVMFGQSAGGASVDMYSYAWAKDPIVHGLISESGVGTNPANPSTNTSEAWFIGSQKLGCGGIEAGESTLQCVRSKSWQELTDIVPRRGVTADLGGGNFGPIYDNETVFPDYNKRRAEGNFAQVPMLIGNTNYERGFYDDLAAERNQTLPADYRPPAKDGCGPNLVALSYRRAGLPAWRYLYAGVWSPSTKPGAGHGDEIALVLGTLDHPTRLALNPSKEARELSLKLRTAWTEFAKDPKDGLKRLGWPLYDEKSEDPKLVRLGGKDTAEIFYEPRSKYDDCPKV